MRSIATISLIVSLPVGSVRAEEPVDYTDLESEAHRYWTRELEDPFSRTIGAIEGGEVVLDRGGELAFLGSLLNAFDIPVASQLLVFSTTSLQLSLISPRNPRAIYFNEDIYIG